MKYSRIFLSRHAVRNHAGKIAPLPHFRRKLCRASIKIVTCSFGGVDVGVGDGAPLPATLEGEEIFIGLGGKCRIIYGNMNVAP